MSAHINKFPEFAHLTADDLAQLLAKSRLSADDRQIAVSTLIWGMAYADIGAAVNMDRATVGIRMRRFIAPQLRQLIDTYIQAVGR